jgi:hypothetical protein
MRAHDTQPEDISLADLCRPISAKVMPRSSLWTDSHYIKDPEEAMKHQRIDSAASFGRRRAKAKDE